DARPLSPLTAMPCPAQPARARRRGKSGDPRAARLVHLRDRMRLPAVVLGASFIFTSVPALAQVPAPTEPAPAEPAAEPASAEPAPAEPAPAEPAPAEPAPDPGPPPVIDLAPPAPAPSSSASAEAPAPPASTPRREGMRLALDLGFWRASGEDPS